MVHGFADPMDPRSLMPKLNRQYLPAWLLALAALGGCAQSFEPPPQPSFYRSLAAPGAELDAAAAQSMISAYRQNNGLSALELDPVLMGIAQEQARTMAARDKLDHGAGRSFTERIKGSG